MVNIEKGKYHLNNKGELLFRLIENDDDLFAQEKEFLNSVKKKISDSRLQSLAKWWEHESPQLASGLEYSITKSRKMMGA